MKKPLDRITEAYFGELGEAFSEKVRNRIHWVCENAKGETILDVGCSQGITSILLGREGKKVIGVDLLKEAIDYANEMLLKEEEATKGLVEFKAANFMQLDFGNQRFDSILFGEVLEHVTDPERFIKKAFTLLNHNGSIIITLPFGINDYFDHKKTYYLMDLLSFSNDSGVIQEIKFFGKWVGAILKKKGEEKSTISIGSELVSRLEEAFFTVEKDLWQQIKNRGQKIKTYEEKIKQLSADITKVKTLAAEQMQEKNNELAAIKDQIIDQESKINSLTSQVNRINQEKKEAIESIQAQLDQKEKEKQESITLFQDRFELMKKEKEESITLFQDQLELLKKEKDMAIDSFRAQVELVEREKEEAIESLQNQLDQKQSEKEDIIDSFRSQLDVKEKEKEEIVNAIYSKINDQSTEQQVKQKDEKIKSLTAQLKQKEELIVELQQKEKNTSKQIAELEKQVEITKKEKIQVQETLYSSYTKEEKLLKSYQKLLRRYHALSESKLGKLTLTYWKKRRKVMGGK